MKPLSDTRIEQITKAFPGRSDIGRMAAEIRTARAGSVERDEDTGLYQPLTDADLDQIEAYYDRLPESIIKTRITRLIEDLRAARITAGIHARTNDRLAEKLDAVLRLCEQKYVGCSDDRIMFEGQVRYIVRGGRSGA